MAVIIFYLGCLLGSFLAFLAQHLPLKQPIFLTRSHCNHCGHLLTFFDLLPLVSLIHNKNKCRYCQTPISLEHSLFEVATGLTFCYFYYQILTWYSFLHFLMTLMLLTLSLTDYLYGLVEPKIFYSFSLLITILFFWNSPFKLIIFLPPLLMTLFFSIYCYFYPQKIGGGDIRLLLFFAFILGFTQTLWITFIASLTALLFSIALLLFQHKMPHSIPFIPFLTFGFICTCFYLF
ncbi:prepilin peptidase [Vagococcus sp.]|uniref:prepilin peptidase n=1 Tax=Vagococcus sp. TaxID=1933889 RepID=UPI003F96A0C9